MFYIVCVLVALPVVLMAQYHIHELKKYEGNEDAIVFWRFLQIASPIIIMLNNILR